MAPTKAQLEAKIAAQEAELELLRAASNGQRQVDDVTDEPPQAAQPVNQHQAVIELPADMSVFNLGQGFSKEAVEEFLTQTKIEKEYDLIIANKPNSSVPNLSAGYVRQLEGLEAIARPLAKAVAVFSTDLSWDTKLAHAKPLLDEGE